ncbi:SH3 domain-containing protein [Escherichia coli]
MRERKARITGSTAQFPVILAAGSPGQILERCEGTYRGIAREDYNARELEVKRGDEVYGLKSLNGWMWCERTSNGQAGWMGSPVAAA